MKVFYDINNLEIITTPITISKLDTLKLLELNPHIYYLFYIITKGSLSDMSKLLKVDSNKLKELTKTNNNIKNVIIDAIEVLKSDILKELILYPDNKNLKNAIDIFNQEIETIKQDTNADDDDGTLKLIFFDGSNDGTITRDFETEEILEKQKIIIIEDAKKRTLEREMKDAEELNNKNNLN